jgi:uncharacterized protein YjbJ (UPF0337 family)
VKTAPSTTEQSEPRGLRTSRQEAIVQEAIGLTDVEALRARMDDHPTSPSAIKGGTMNRFGRIMMGGVGMCVVAVVASPLSSSAWHQKGLSIFSTSVPIVMVLNEDQLKGNWKQFKGELKKKWGNFTDDDILYIEGSRDKLEGKIQERYGDRKDEVRKWIDEWFEQNKASHNMTP